ncbi:MAG: hypothetical protein ACK2UB_08915 [Anaerolineales bacterium]
MNRIPLPGTTTAGANPLAIISLVLAVLGIPLIFCYGCGVVLSVAAVFAAVIARHQIARSGGREGGGGIAMIGLIVGLASIGMVLLGVVCYILFFAILMFLPADQYYSLLLAGIPSLM